MSGFAKLTPQREYQIAWDLIYEKMSVKETAAKYSLPEDQILEIKARARRILETYESRKREQQKHARDPVKHVFIVLLFLVLFFPIALAYMWTQTPWRTKNKIIISLLIIVPFMMAAFYLIYLDQQHRVEVEYLGFTKPQPPFREREHLGVSVEQYAEFFKGIENQPLEIKKQEWRVLFADQWVQWDGYLGGWESDSTISLKTSLGADLKVRVQIPPKERYRFRLRNEGKRITVSGRVVAAHFWFDRVTLTDAYLSDFDF